jgi:hypothetical protein
MHLVPAGRLAACCWLAGLPAGCLPLSGRPARWLANWLTGWHAGAKMCRESGLFGALPGKGLVECLGDGAGRMGSVRRGGLGPMAGGALVAGTGRKNDMGGQTGVCMGEVGRRGVGRRGGVGPRSGNRGWGSAWWVGTGRGLGTGVGGERFFLIAKKDFL